MNIQKITYLTFLFHFNQNLVPYAAVANEVCYKGLLKVLLSHPKLKFMIHISGTLLNALQWLDRTVIELINEGIKRGQFELVGSTYAQNIMYSSDDRDNIWQIRLHRELLQEIFNVQPVLFWNPERCFRQTFVQLLLENGYKFTWIEDHILQGSGIKEDVDYLITEDNLGIFVDRKDFLKKVNNAVYTGNFAPCFEFINSKQERLLNYAEDAEAMGLWQFEGYEKFAKDTNPKIILENLDKFLTEIEKQPDLQITTLTEYAAQYIPLAVISEIKDGQAFWMVEAIKNPTARYHEDGFSDWFDFNSRSMDLIFFRRLYTTVRNIINILQFQLKQKIRPFIAIIGEKLLYHLRLLFAIHQYEFGCIGVVRIRDMQWEGIRGAFLIAYISQIALLNPKTGILIQDVDLDGLPEIFFIIDRQVFVFSPIGGKLIAWFDLNTGAELVGNECTSFYGEQLSYYNPTLFLRLPKIEDTEIKFENARFTLRRRALNDIIGINIDNISDTKTRRQEIKDNKLQFFNSSIPLEVPLEAKYNYRIASNQIYFTYQSDSLKIQKIISPVQNGINVRYEFENIFLASHDISIYIENEFIPDYIEVITRGRDILSIKQEKNKYFIFNTTTSIGVELEAIKGIDKVEFKEGFLGLELNPFSKISLMDKNSFIMEFNLTRCTSIGD